MGIKRQRADGQYEDELYNVANLAGYGGSKIWDETLKVYKVILNKYPDDYRYNEIPGDMVENSMKLIEKGIPVILSMDYKEDWNHGHVVVIVGYIKDFLIINDPYGDSNTGYKEHNGAFVEYDSKKWLIGQKWACYLTK